MTREIKVHVFEQISNKTQLHQDLFFSGERDAYVMYLVVILAMKTMFELVEFLKIQTVRFQMLIVAQLQVFWRSESKKLVNLRASQ